MNVGGGIAIAVVSEVDDPEALGQVKVKFPWLAEDGAESGWIRIVRPMAGSDRGFYYQPEVGDEALVAYEWGDMNHPVVLGFLHSRVDKPPANGIDIHVRRLRTTAGHQLEFDDRQGSESVRVTSNAGHQLELHDDGRHVELETTGGQKLRMDDVPARIRLETIGGTTITMEDLPSSISIATATGVTVTVSDTGGVSISAPTGAVSVSSLTASVTASAGLTLSAPMMTVNAPMATFAGVVQCSALMTQAVVSTSYTPGLGNLV